MSTRIPIHQPINDALDHVAWKNVCKKAYVVTGGPRNKIQQFSSMVQHMYGVGPQYGRVQPLSVIVSTRAREMDC